MSLHLTFDIPGRRAVGDATIDFEATDDGFPYFVLDGKVLGARLNGEDVEIKRVKPPLATSTFTVVHRLVARGSANVLELQYQMDDSEVSFHDGGVGFLTSMGDLQTGRFFEQYGPSSFEDDPHRISVEIHLKGATRKHRIFANGRTLDLGQDHWKVDFPAYYNSNSIYMHVTDTPLTVIEGTYSGLEKAIPYAIYSQTPGLAHEAAELLPSLFAELEETYGPYLHASFVAYVSGKGGMEHAGAAITSVGALDHELLHSWFARGVMPSDGRSGWIDEGIASWRDKGYFRSSWPPNRPETNLANFPAFERFTPKNCYRDGRQLMSELDGLLAKRGGLRPVLREFFAQSKGTNISTPLFQAFLETHLGTDLDSVFEAYVYGGFQSRLTGQFDERELDRGDRHPPKLSRAEILKLR